LLILIILIGVLQIRIGLRVVIYGLGRLLIILVSLVVEMVFLHVVWRVIVLVRLGYSDCVDLGNLDNFLLWLVEWLVYST
jgi:hypothetical protein